MYDIETIKQQFAKVISFSQGIEHPKVDELFQIWETNKQKWIDKFKGELIIELPLKVTFNLDKESKSSRLNEFADMIWNVYNNGRLVDFIEANQEAFYKNILEKDYHDETVSIPAGMKMVKAFKYFEDNKEILSVLQNLASVLIQENKVEGKLCFSVHPLDYLSLSQNTYNWRSCHSLDGEHRAGNLSYMLDKSTVICYLKGEDGVRLPMFPEDVLWNSKKWRTLLYISDQENLIFASRSYPFSSSTGVDLALTYFVDIIQGDKSYNWTNVSNYGIRDYTDTHGEIKKLNHLYIPLADKLYDVNTMFIEPNNALHFNDVKYSTYYNKPYYIYRNPDFWYSSKYVEVTFSVGHDIPCLYCEEKIIESADTFICNDCDLKYGTEENNNFVYCDCCGRREYRDNLYSVYIGGGDYELVCEHCANTECFECANCSNLIYNSDKIYDSDTNEYYCNECFEVL